MKVQAQIELLESLPLLGAEKRQAIELADQVALDLNPDEQPSLALRLLIRRFLAQPSTPDTLAQLSTAEAWASSEGEHHLALKLQLIWCRYVGLTDPDAVPLSILQDAIDQAQSERILDAEWRLALAAVHPSEGLYLREEALKYLRSPETAHDQLRVHLELAHDRRKGADLAGSLSHLDEAYSIAMAHHDPEQSCICAMRIGLLYTDRGLAEKAVPYLEHALTIASSEDDDLTIVALATLLSPHYLQTQEYNMATDMADLLLVSGARRANWFAVVDGHITQSSLSLLQDDPQGAIERLVRATLRLQKLVPSAAINLLKGRLAELRHELGADTFDSHYQRAMQDHLPA